MTVDQIGVPIIHRRYVRGLLAGQYPTHQRRNKAATPLPSIAPLKSLIIHPPMPALTLIAAIKLRHLSDWKHRVLITQPRFSPAVPTARAVTVFTPSSEDCR